MKQTYDLPQGATKPAFCDTQDDFYKFIFAYTRGISDTAKEMDYNIFGIKLLLHEYMALVLSGKMTPYLFTRELVDHEKEGFRDLMHSVNEQFAEIGLPMKEGDNGKLEFDIDKIKAEHAKLLKELEANE